MNPAIVVQAYNRPPALARLLGSLARATYPTGAQVPLVISIDRGNDPRNAEVRACADAFQWEYGPKEVLHHSEHLGMVNHIFFCGGLTEKYGSVVFLEDDLFVSPVFYHYAAQALADYANDPHIGGVSLYALWYNGYTHHPFVPLADEGDVFFLQIPYTQGQAWTRAQWQRFARWRQANAHRLRPAPGDDLHEMWLHFDADDQFPIMTKYLVETEQFYVLPRVAHATGFGDAGVHFRSPSVYFQIPLQREQMSYRFKPLSESCAVYDSFFEILPDRLNRLTNTLRDYDYAVDLNATKSPRHVHAPHVLTTRVCRAAVRTFAQEMWPLEANVIEGLPGAGITLARTKDVRRDGWADLRTRKRNHDYFTRQRRVSRRQRLSFAFLDWLDAARRRFR